MNQDLLDRIHKLIPRLGSDHDGEIIATVRAIRAALQAQGCDLHDLVRAIDPTGTSSTPIAATISRAPKLEELSPLELNAWLEALLRQDWLSPLSRDVTIAVRQVLCCGAYGRMPRNARSLINEALARAHALGVRP